MGSGAVVCGHLATKGTLALEGRCVVCVDGGAVSGCVQRERLLLLRSATHGGADTEPPGVGESQ